MCFNVQPPISTAHGWLCPSQILCYPTFSGEGHLSSLVKIKFSCQDFYKRADCQLIARCRGRTQKGAIRILWVDGDHKGHVAQPPTLGKIPSCPGPQVPQLTDSDAATCSGWLGNSVFPPSDFHWGPSSWLCNLGSYKPLGGHHSSHQGVVQFNIYLAVLALSCSLWDLGSLTRMEAFALWALGGVSLWNNWTSIGSPEARCWHNPPAQGSRPEEEVPFSNLPLPGQLDGWGWAELVLCVCLTHCRTYYSWHLRTWSDTVYWKGIFKSISWSVQNRQNLSSDMTSL